MIELTADELSLVQHALACYLPQAKVTAFGSRMRRWPFGRGCRPFSGMALAIEFAEPRTDEALAEVRADLEDSSLPWRVNIMPT